VGLFLSLFSIKPLNALLLGENYARSLGLNYKRTRLIIILLPVFWQEYNCFFRAIAFIGLFLILQNWCFRPVTTILFWSTLLLERVLLICDSISQVPGGDITLPINAVTSVFGANSNLVAS
jgi:iron complex transport system permease protein